MPTEMSPLLRMPGLTVREAAVRYRVSEDKIRAWVKAGTLRAVNTSDTKSAKPRYIIPPEALTEFERARSAATEAPKPTRRRKTVGQDFFPGD